MALEYISRNRILDGKEIPKNKKAHFPNGIKRRRNELTKNEEGSVLIGEGSQLEKLFEIYSKSEHIKIFVGAKIEIPLQANFYKTNSGIIRFYNNSQFQNISLDASKMRIIWAEAYNEEIFHHLEYANPLFYNTQGNILNKINYLKN